MHLNEVIEITPHGTHHAHLADNLYCYRHNGAIWLMMYEDGRVLQHIPMAPLTIEAFDAYRWGQGGAFGRKPGIGRAA